MPTNESMPGDLKLFLSGMAVIFMLLFFFFVEDIRHPRVVACPKDCPCHKTELTTP